jgi:hypothetical protein
LAWLCADGIGDVPHDLNRIPIGLEVLALETGIELAVVLCWTFLRTPDVILAEAATRGSKFDILAKPTPSDRDARYSFRSACRQSIETAVGGCDQRTSVPQLIWIIYKRNHL